MLVNGQGNPAGMTPMYMAGVQQPGGMLTAMQ